ncbi:MAG: HAD family hydrolase [Candidatus Acidiferrales bacterium]|jgi:D-glycero-D-manno-heptose 1,7-bisphosphate phosphatase
MKRRAVFLDRDGVINRYAHNPELGTIDSPATPREFELLPGAGEAIAELNRMNLPVVVVSNQPGIAHGKFTPELLDGINEAMRARLAWDGARLSAVLYCRHHPHARLPEYRIDCECRKPKPGLFLRAAREHNLDLSASFLIGGGLADVLAGCAAGVTTLLVAPHRGSLHPECATGGSEPDLFVRDLRHAVSAIRALLGIEHRLCVAPHANLPYVVPRGELN